MTEFLAVLGLAVQGGIWLRRWARAHAPFYRVMMEAEVHRMALQTQQRARELAPPRASLPR